MESLETGSLFVCKRQVREIADGKIVIETGLDTSGIEKGIGKISSIASTGLKSTVAVIGGVSTALVGAGGYAIKVGSDFESAMSKVEAISGSTESQIEQLTEKAKEMGATTKFSATESAEAFQYMAMAGWNSAQMIDGISGIMNLAAADGLDLATTSDIVTDALTAFGLAASDSTHFADVLATASSNANTNVSMLGESFKHVAPVAGAMKYSVEDVSKALGLMANASVKGSMAGTSLKTALSNLAAPTNKMKQAMKKYGISLTDSEGNMKSLDEVMKNLRESLGDLSEKEQTAAATTIFGKEAMAGMLAIVNASEEDYKKLSDAITNADGTAQKMADTMNDNLQGKITLAKSAIEGLGIQFYETVQDDMKDAVEEGITYIDQLSDAFTNGGLEAAVVKSGDIIAQLAIKIAESAPDMVDASTDLIEAFVRGISKNKRKLKTSAKEIVKALSDGLVKLLPKGLQKPVQESIDDIKKSFKNGGLDKAVNTTERAITSLSKVISTTAKVALPPLVSGIDFLGDNLESIAPLAIGAAAAFASYKGVVATIDAVTAAQQALNTAISLNTAGVVIAGITAAIVALSSAMALQGNSTKELKTANDELGSSWDEISQKAIEFQNGISSAGSIFDGFNESLIVSTEKQQECSQKMDEIQREITSIAEKATEERRNLTQTEIDRLDELFAQMKELTAKELAYQQAYQEAVQTSAEALKNTYDGTAEGYAASAQTIMNSAYETKDAVVSKAYEQMNETNAINKQMLGTDAQYNQEWYEQQCEASAKAYQQAVDAANKQCADTLAIIQQGYSDRMTSGNEWLQNVAEMNTLELEENKRHKQTLEQIEADYGEHSNNYKSDAITATITYNAQIENAETEHKEKLAQIRSGLADSLNDANAEQVGAWLAMVAQTSLYGGQLDAETQSAIDSIIENWDSLPDDTKESMTNTLQGMIDGFRNNEPALLTQAQATTGNFLQRLNEELGVHSPSWKTEEMMGYVIDGAIQGLESNSDRLAESGSNVMQNLIESLSDSSKNMDSIGVKIADAFANGLKKSNMQSTGISLIGKALTGMYAHVQSYSGKMNSAGSNIGKSTITGLKSSNLSSNFQSQAKNAVTMLCSAIRSMTPTAVSTTKGLGTSVIKALASCDLGSNSQTQGRLFGNSFSTGVRSQNGSVFSAATAIGNSAKSALSGFGGSGYNIGTQFSNGIARGIRAGEGGVAAAAAAVANAAARAAKANLQIHSPSRVGGYIGRMFDKGIELNVEKGVSGIEKAVENVTDVMKINPSELLSSMKGAFNSNVARIVSEKAIRVSYMSGGDLQTGSSIDANTLSRIVDQLAERFADEMENVSVKVGERSFGRLVREVKC